MKRIFSLRCLAWLIGSFIALCALVVFVENWTGAHALASAKLKLEQAGETLDLAALRPKPVPDAVNFCAIAPLVGITQTDEESGKSRRAVCRSLDWSSLWEKHRNKLPWPALNGGCVRAIPFDLKQASAWLREVTYLDSPADASPAQVLASIDRLHPLLKELGDAAPARAESVFIPEVGAGYEGAPAQMPVPHLNSVTSIVKGLALRSHVATEAADTEAAVRSIQASSRLTRALGEDPTLLGLLTAVTMSTYELNSIWSLLHRHEATEAQLARLQADIERQDFMASALLAVRGELAFQTDSIEWIKQHDISRMELYFTVTESGDFETQNPTALQTLLVRLLPAGLFDHNAANTISYHSAYVLEPLKTRDISQITHSFDALNDKLRDLRGLSHPHHIVPVAGLSQYRFITEQAIYCEALRRQAVTAIAVQRHQLRHGKLPGTLDELVPTFLKAAPLDPIDGQPMRYRAEGSTMTLWSIALDRKDHQGRLPSQKEARQVHRSDYAADWVWKY